MDEQNRRQRLRFRSWHRGTREMDLLMGSFADAHGVAFSLPEIVEYEAILELPDPDIFNWVTGVEPVPCEHDSAVMRKLIAHQYARQKNTVS